MRRTCDLPHTANILNMKTCQAKQNVVKKDVKKKMKQPLQLNFRSGTLTYSLEDVQYHSLNLKNDGYQKPNLKDMIEKPLTP